MTRERFEQIAQAAFDSLPEFFTNKIDNVRIIIEDYPSEEELKQVGGRKHSLLGLYQGIPFPHRGSWYGAAPVVPDTITLYQKNIEAACKDEEEIERRIVEVLFHELGHYFGMNEKQIRQAMRHYL
jgi:predicted Zn-dependent protease with MMP-like domain